MSRRNRKIHNGHNNHNGHNGTSLQHYFIAVGNDDNMSASQRACAAERDILAAGGQHIMTNNFGSLVRLHFSLTSGSVKDLEGQGHKVYPDNEPYLAY